MESNYQIKFRPQFKSDSCVSACIDYLFQMKKPSLKLCQEYIYDSLGETTNKDIINFLENFGLKCKLKKFGKNSLKYWLETESNEFALIDIKQDGHHCNLINNFNYNESGYITTWEPLNKNPITLLLFDELWSKISMKKDISAIIIY